MGKVPDVTYEEFENILQTETRPIIVDTWAPWCGPCKGIEPFFEQLIKDIKKNFTIDHHYFIFTLNEYIYARMKNKAIYICECSNNVSVSQTKIEFNTFIEDMQKQSKFPKFLTSIFDR